MLTQKQFSLIKALHTKKGRIKHQRCLVEGSKNIAAAGDHIEFTFTDREPHFHQLVTTEQPQRIAGVATLPEWTDEDIRTSNTILLLDYVQDPGNVGAIFRLAQGFDATIVLVESADPTNSKVIRSSAGALFHVPWITVKRDDIGAWCDAIDHTLFRLENREQSGGIELFNTPTKALLIVGSEGNGIQLEQAGQSIAVQHRDDLESLNVGHATAIALHNRFQAQQ